MGVRLKEAMSRISDSYQGHGILSSTAAELVNRKVTFDALSIVGIREKDTVLMDTQRHRRQYHYIKQASFSLLCNSVDPTLILLVLSMTA